MKNPFTYLYYTGLLVLIVTLTFTTFFVVKFSSIIPSLLSQQKKNEYYKETEIIPKGTSEIKEPEAVVVKPKVEKKPTTTTQTVSQETTMKKDSGVVIERKMTDTSFNNLDTIPQTPLEL